MCERQSLINPEIEGVSALHSGIFSKFTSSLLKLANSGTHAHYIIPLSFILIGGLPPFTEIIHSSKYDSKLKILRI